MPTFGGLNGYVSGIRMSSMKFPPSYGVSGGPAISPFSSVKLSFFSSNFILHFATCRRRIAKRTQIIIIIISLFSDSYLVGRVPLLLHYGFVGNLSYS